MAILFVILAAALVACGPTKVVTADFGVAIHFRGEIYLGYEDATRGFEIGTLPSVGTADAVRAPVQGNDVLAMPGIDPDRAVVMRAQPDLNYQAVLFVNRRLLVAAGSSSLPFGSIFPDLCPVLAMPVLREGCP